MLRFLRGCIRPQREAAAAHDRQARVARERGVRARQLAQPERGTAPAAYDARVHARAAKAWIHRTPLPFPDSELRPDADDAHLAAPLPGAMRKERARAAAGAVRGHRDAV